MRGTRVVGRALFATDVPIGWSVAPSAAADVDLTLIGPENVNGLRPRVQISARGGGAATIEGASVDMMRRVQDERSESFLASCDIWPHPLWKHGRFIQSAGLSDGTAMAHDCYLFVDHDRQVVITLDCPLEDLLAVEDSVAEIVAHVRPVEEGDR